MRHAERRERRTGRASRELATVGLAVFLYGLLLLCYYVVVASHATDAVWLAGMSYRWCLRASAT